MEQLYSVPAQLLQTFNLACNLYTSFYFCVYVCVSIFVCCSTVEWINFVDHGLLLRYMQVTRSILCMHGSLRSNPHKATYRFSYPIVDATLDMHDKGAGDPAGRKGWSRVIFDVQIRLSVLKE